MRQTELKLSYKDTSKPPYNGQFFCPIRQEFNNWSDHINWYKAKRL